MDWDKLKIFHAVAEAGSFTNATVNLNLSQSAISRQIQSLEQDLEVLQKALECRKADILKYEETGAEYFIKLIGSVQDAKKDNELIEKALIKINQRSE